MNCTVIYQGDAKSKNCYRNYIWKYKSLEDKSEITY